MAGRVCYFVLFEERPKQLTLFSFLNRKKKVPTKHFWSVLASSPFLSVEPLEIFHLFHLLSGSCYQKYDASRWESTLAKSNNCSIPHTSAQNFYLLFFRLVWKAQREECKRLKGTHLYPIIHWWIAFHQRL